VAKVASVGVAVVPVGNRGSNVGNGGVERELVWHEGAVVGVGGGHTGVVVGKGVGLGVSLSLGLPLLASQSQVDERSDLVDSSMGQGNRVDSSSHWGDSMVDEGGGGVVDQGGDVMEDRVGDNLVAHLSWHLND